MCRFAAYIGSEILMAELLFRPGHSLIRQSFKAKERPEPLNGDGFGLGWYTPEVTSDPCIFKSISPAWSNKNLEDLAEHVRSGCFFAHVRAASPGMAVTETNCHPFRIGRYMWMHNGTVRGFKLIKRWLCDSLPDDLYHAIDGTTDSEHAFAVFLNILDKQADASTAELSDALVKTIAQLEEWVRKAGIKEPSIYNFAVTDGTRMATVRFVSDPQTEPISLYFSKQGKYRCIGGRPEIVESSRHENGVIVASERLTEDNDDWVRVAPNHVLTVDGRLAAKLSLIPEL